MQSTGMLLVPLYSTLESVADTYREGGLNPESMSARFLRGCARDAGWNLTIDVNDELYKGHVSAIAHPDGETDPGDRIRWSMRGFSNDYAPLLEIIRQSPHRNILFVVGTPELEDEWYGVASAIKAALTAHPDIYGERCIMCTGSFKPLTGYKSTTPTELFEDDPALNRNGAIEHLRAYGQTDAAKNLLDAVDWMQDPSLSGVFVVMHGRLLHPEHIRKDWTHLQLMAPQENIVRENPDMELPQWAEKNLRDLERAVITR